MIKLKLKHLLALIIIAGFHFNCLAEDNSNSKNIFASYNYDISLPKNLNLYGWEYLANKLHQHGVSLKSLTEIYGKGRMPRFEPVTFTLDPKESPALYSKFITKANINLGRKFINDNRNLLTQVEKEFKVNHKVISAILLVETFFGKNTGDQIVIHRLSRLANINNPNNLEFNYQKLKKEDSKVSFAEVKSRGQYLEDTFFPEVLALIKICTENKINYFNIKGSSAGAFGWPQFLPSSYLKFAVDYNRDGVKSLYQKEDAVASVANYLKENGWSENAPLSLQRQVIWKYNKSDAYIDTILKLANLL